MERTTGGSSPVFHRENPPGSKGLSRPAEIVERENGERCTWLLNYHLEHFINRVTAPSAKRDFIGLFAHSPVNQSRRVKCNSVPDQDSNRIGAVNSLLSLKATADRPLINSAVFVACPRL